MALLDYNFTKSSFRAFGRFLTFFVLIYVVSTFTLAAFGVFDSAEAESEVEESTTASDNVAGKSTSVAEVQEEVVSIEEEAIEVEEVAPMDTETEVSASEKVEENLDPRIPHVIWIPAIGLDTTIVNPRSRDIEALNRALLDGVVYYPGSGHLGEDSNIFLFGHSSGLPVVINQNFKIFNRIKELKLADAIYLEAGGYQYTYRVIDSYEAKDHQIIVDFLSSTPKLTLTTCNVFGAKEDRFIVEAVLAEKVKVR